MRVAPVSTSIHEPTALRNGVDHAVFGSWSSAADARAEGASTSRAEEFATTGPS